MGLTLHTHTHTYLSEGLFLMSDNELFEIGNKTTKLVFLKDVLANNKIAAIEEYKKKLKTEITVDVWNSSDKSDHRISKNLIKTGLERYGLYM